MLTDKLQAKKGGGRIPERVLLGVALLGGSFGCFLGMILFRHKTRKPRFAMGFPAILLLHLLIVSYWIFVY